MPMYITAQFQRLAVSWNCQSTYCIPYPAKPTDTPRTDVPTDILTHTNGHLVALGPIEEDVAEDLLHLCTLYVIAFCRRATSAPVHMVCSFAEEPSAPIYLTCRGIKV